MFRLHPMVWIFLSCGAPAFASAGDEPPRKPGSPTTESSLLEARYLACRGAMNLAHGKHVPPIELLRNLHDRHEVPGFPYVMARFAIGQPHATLAEQFFFTEAHFLLETSGGRMEARRADWRPYLAGRDSGLETYAARTIYLQLQKDSRHREEWNAGTFALTYSQHRRETLEALRPMEIVADDSLNLPKEKTLRRAVPRYVDSHGEGITVELRAFSKDENAKIPSEVQKLILMEGIVTGLQLTYPYPELAHLPLFQTFGDRDSMALYGGVVNGRPTIGALKLGFQINEANTPIDRPMIVYDTSWWDLQTSHANLESWLMKQKVIRAPSYTLLRSHEVRLPNDQILITYPGAAFVTDMEGRVIRAVTETETEIGPGIRGWGQILWDRGFLRFLEESRSPIIVQTSTGPVEIPFASQVRAMPPREAGAHADGKYFGSIYEVRCVRAKVPWTIAGVTYAAGTSLHRYPGGDFSPLTEGGIDLCARD